MRGLAKSFSFGKAYGPSACVCTRQVRPLLFLIMANSFFRGIKNLLYGGVFFHEKYSTNADAHIYTHTLNLINVYTHNLPL